MAQAFSMLAEPLEPPKPTVLQSMSARNPTPHLQHLQTGEADSFGSLIQPQRAVASHNRPRKAVQLAHPSERLNGSINPCLATQPGAHAEGLLRKFAFS